MLPFPRLVVPLVSLVLASACTSPAPSKPAADQASHDGHGGAAPVTERTKLLGNLGSFSRAIQTASPEAQQFFDEGLTLLYGFNHDEAARYFRRAAAKGNAIAQNRLARLLVVGRGVPANKIDAAAWHILAAAQGLADPWLDNALKELTAEERKRAEKLVGERLGVK